MALTAALRKELNLGDRRVKIFKLTSTSTTTSINITPGKDFGAPVGCYSYYTVSSGVYTFTCVAVNSGTNYGYIAFFSPVQGV
jgi:hypothetical protein